MDVELEDGTIIEDVPEGITQSELKRRLGRPPSDVPNAATGVPSEGPPGFKSLKPQDPSMLQGALLGPSKSIYEMGLGIADLAPGVDLTKQIDDSRKYGNLGLVGDVGKVGMDIATAALPAAGALKGTQALGIGSKLLQGAANVGGQVGLGAIQGAAEPVGTGESRGLNTALGAGAALGGEVISGAAGQVRKIPNAIRSLLGSKVTPQYQEALEAAARQGIPLNTGQMTNNPTTRQTQTILDELSTDNPLFLKPRPSIAEGQHKAINQRAADLLESTGGQISPDQATRQLQQQLARQIGQTGKVIDPRAPRGYLGAQLGGEYDQLLRGRGAHQITRQTTDEAQALIDALQGRVAQPSAGAVGAGRRLANTNDLDLEVLANRMLEPGTMSGPEFQEARSFFNEAARKNAGKPTGRFADQMAEVLNRSFGREYGDADLTRLRALDAEYARFLANKGAIPKSAESALGALERGDTTVSDAVDALGARGAQRTARQSAASDVIDKARDKATRDVNPEQLAKAIGAESRSSLARKFGSTSGDVEDLRRAIAEVIQPERSSYGKWRKAQAELQLGTAGMVGGQSGKFTNTLLGALKTTQVPTWVNRGLNHPSSRAFLMSPPNQLTPSDMLRPGFNAAIAQLLMEANQ